MAWADVLSFEAAMDVDSFKAAVAPLLKDHGFKKSNATWRKNLGETLAVFNVQKSQWGAVYYINLGVYFRALGTETNPTENRCHIQARLKVEDPPEVVAKAVRWYEGHSSIELAKRSLDVDEKRGLVMKEVKNAAEK